MSPNIGLPTILSLVSLCISVFIAGWTVYKDVIRRPKFRVDAAIKNIYVSENKTIGPDVHIDALNLGPSENRIGVIYARPSWFDRRVRGHKSAFIYPDYAHLGNSAKNQRVPVGDSVTFVLPLNAESWNLAEFYQIGVSDGYGTCHWVKPKDFRKLQNDIFAKLEKLGIAKPTKTNGSLNARR